MNHIRETIDWLNVKGQEFDKRADEAESQIPQLREKAACMRRVAESLGEMVSDKELVVTQEDHPEQSTHNAAGRRIVFTGTRKQEIQDG